MVRPLVLVLLEGWHLSEPRVCLHLLESHTVVRVLNQKLGHQVNAVGAVALPLWQVKGNRLLAGHLHGLLLYFVVEGQRRAKHGIQDAPETV